MQNEKYPTTKDSATNSSGSNGKATYVVYDRTDHDIVVCIGDKYEVGNYLGIPPNQVAARVYHCNRASYQVYAPQDKYNRYIVWRLKEEENEE